MHKKNKKCLNKVEKLCKQIIQGPYFICTMRHRCLYKRSVRLFDNEKYNILTAELHCPVRSFVEKRIYVKNVINTFLEMKCHVKQSSIKCV